MTRRSGRSRTAAASAFAGVLALCACGPLSGLDPFAATSPPVAPAAGRADPAPAVAPGAGATTPGTTALSTTAPGTTAEDDAPVPDGRYAGLAILTAFHGDCNAGGTGQIVVHGRALTYRDDRNPPLSGLLGEHGSVDLAAGGTRLIGNFTDAVFTGRIAGGACEYQMRYERVPG